MKNKKILGKNALIPENPDDLVKLYVMSLKRLAWPYLKILVMFIFIYFVWSNIYASMGFEKAFIFIMVVMFIMISNCLRDISKAIRGG